MEELSEQKEFILLFAYVYGSISVRAEDREINELTKVGYLRRRETNERIHKLTEQGKEYIELSPPELLVVRISSMLDYAGLRHLKSTWELVEALIGKVGLGGLPMLLSHESDKIRELARERFEKLKESYFRE